MEIHLNKTPQNEKEILEMILQFFYENKYLESAKLLESKANIIYDQNEIQQLKYLLKNHKFDESVKFLENSNFENIQKAEVLKILKSRKFLELIKGEDKTIALEYLRNDIAPLINDSAVLNKYSLLLFQKEIEVIEKILKQNFSDINSDEFLISKIQSLLCLSLDSNGNRILPNSRLETLLDKYVEMNNNDMDIDDDDKTSTSRIKMMFEFGRNFIIEKHDDEVWHLELSLSKKNLATCSRNGMIGIFKINFNNNIMKIDCVSYFLAHKKYITGMQWSRNEKFILTSSSDKMIKLWDPFEAKCLKTFLLHTDIVSSIKWLNDETFVSGGIDKKMIICTTGNRVLCSEIFSRIRKVLFSLALNCLIIIPASINDIIFYDHKNFVEVHRITELDPIISSNLSINDNGKFLITNISKVNASINLYDLSTFKLVNKYYGHTQEQFTIEFSFAGMNDEFIICGSEDSSIHIWHRNSSIAIGVVKGHTGSVNNCLLSFHNEKPYVISVSDDYTLRVFTHCDEVIYEDLTLSNKSRKLSEMYRQSHRDVNLNECINLIEDEANSDNHSVSEHIAQNESLEESD